MLLRLNKRAQSTLEYALLIAAIVGGLVAMQIYVKRGFQGRLRSASDDIGEQFDADHTASSYTTTRSSTSTESTVAGISTSTIDAAAPEVVTRTGSETVSAW
ncbi:MAG: hypothetical protein JW714_01070 [Candidatus Omnitrophica bacterium]|nr:hypothetical protein [Candidatus Omnitrophota bacterium]